nr:hypothetical protein [Tanacetum cinerariifolium]
MSIQELEDLKQQYLDELKRLINSEYRDEIKIYKLKQNFNGMRIEINKKEKLLQLERWANLSTYPSKHFNSFCYDDDEEDFTIAVTPSLSTEEPDNSLSMGDEHLDTIPTTESDEFIKSSVENLIPIPSESEGIPDNMCDVSFHDNSSPLDASPHNSKLVSSEVMEIVIPEVGGIDDDILLTIKDDILREKLLNVNLLIAIIEALNDNPTPSFDFKTKSSSTSLNSLLEETNTFDNSLTEFETFCFDMEEISSGSTTTHSDISLLEYEAFYDDHVKEISSGSTTTHFDSPLYDSFIFDLLINPFPPADRSDFYEFVDELIHFISPPEYDCFLFKIEPNSGGFHHGCGGGYFSNKRTKTAQSSNVAMLATMNQIVNLLSGFQKQFPPTNNQLETSSNSKSHATVHDGQIVTETVQRKATGNVGNTDTRGTQSYGQVTDNKGKMKKRVKDSQYFKEKMMLMEAREKGAVLDAEAEAFLADVECTAPYDQPLAITTTNNFEVSHEDAYDSDVDEGPHAAVAFMANLSSTSGTNGATTSHVNEVHTDNNQIFNNVNHLLAHEMHQEEHLDSDVESNIDENTILYHQYQLDSKVQDVPTEVSSMSLGEISMISTLDDLRNQLDGHFKVNQEQSMVNDSLRAELARSLGSSNRWYAKQAKIAQPTLYDGHALLKPTNTLIIVHDSKESLVEAEVSRTKMSNRPRTTKPINYAELNALDSHLVPQKELSREQVYWLPAEELATQKSNPPKPVTPFIHTCPAPSKVRTHLLKLKDCFPAFETIIKRRTTPTFHKQGEWRFFHTKKAYTEQVIPFYEHVKELVQSLDENLVKEITEFMRIFNELDKEDKPLSEELSSNCVRENSKVIELEAEILKQQQMLAESDKRFDAVFEINQLNEQPQGKDVTIRLLQSQINNMSMLNVESTVGSFVKQALETELTQLKDAITSVRIQNDRFKVEN